MTKVFKIQVQNTWLQKVFKILSTKYSLPNYITNKDVILNCDKKCLT
jgi:hypothetical protein